MASQIPGRGDSAFVRSKQVWPAVGMENGVRVRVHLSVSASVSLCSPKDVESSRRSLDLIYFHWNNNRHSPTQLPALPPCHGTQGIYTSPDLTPYPD